MHLVVHELVANTTATREVAEVKVRHVERAAAVGKLRHAVSVVVVLPVAARRGRSRTTSRCHTTDGAQTLQGIFVRLVGADELKVMLYPIRLDGFDCATINCDSLALVQRACVAKRERNCEDKLHSIGRHVLEHIVASEEVSQAVGDGRSELADDLIVFVEEQHTSCRTRHGRPTHLLHALHVHLIDSRSGRLAEVGWIEHVTHIESGHIYSHKICNDSRVGSIVDCRGKRHTASG